MFLAVNPVDIAKVILVSSVANCLCSSIDVVTIAHKGDDTLTVVS